jgi:hypothetical protein
MANPEHLAILEQGVEAWNKWREENPKERPDLQEANLQGANLSGADFSGTVLEGANLSMANLNKAQMNEATLSGANLIWTVLEGANLSGANLSGANLSEAILIGADLSGAILIGADLREADLRWTNLNKAQMNEAILNGADLIGADLSWTDLSGARLSVAYLRSLSRMMNESERPGRVDFIRRLFNKSVRGVCLSVAYPALLSKRSTSVFHVRFYPPSYRTLSEIRHETNGEGTSLSQKSVDEIETDAKDAQITAVPTIDEMAIP